MRTFLSLLQREWLQHRFGWSLALLLPLAVALLVAGIAHIDVDVDGGLPRPEQLPLIVALASVLGSTLVLFIIGALTSLVIVSGLARRDHADRSIEFWLSLPTGHAASLGAPLVAHLLLMPAAAAVLGWVGGQLLTLTVFGRGLGLAAWAALPWPELAAATLAFLARLLGGLPLALLWVAPIVMILVLLGAWFRRWGWVVLIVSFGLLSLVQQLTSGERWLTQITVEILRRAGLSLFGAGGASLRVERDADAAQMLAGMPALALHDFGAALQALASPLLAGGLVLAAACFWSLVEWRKRGAGVAG